MSASGGLEAALGYRCTEWRDGYAVVELELQPMHGNRSGNLHGGVVTTLLDVACARAGLWSADPEKPRYGSTVSLTVNFLAPIRHGTIRATGTLESGGRTLFTTTGRLLAPDGTLLAVAQSVYRYRPGSEAPRPGKTPSHPEGETRR